MSIRRNRSTDPTLAVSDAFSEVWLDLTSRAARSSLTALGTLIGIAVLVSTLGLAKSAGSRISTRFDALAATEVVARPMADPARAGAVEGGRADGAEPDPSALPTNAATLVAGIDGVVAASTFSDVKGVKLVLGTPIVDPTRRDAPIPVVSSSPELAATVHATVTGRMFDRFHDERGESVAVLGATAAQQLNVSSVARQPVIFLDDRPVVVVGIISSTERKPELLDAVIVPDGFARRHLRLSNPAELLIETRIGAAEVVGGQVPFALRPDMPRAVRVVVPPSPTLTRDQVVADSNALFLVLAAISLIIGGVGIANVTLVSVLERVAEIGLRRALGARRMHIAAQFLLESMVLGLLGSTAGGAVGVVVTVVVALSRDWPPTMDPWLPFVAPLAGVAIGLVAGLYPAARAARIEPIEALRTSG